MTGYAQLWAADPAGWETAGSAWLGVGSLVDRRAEELTNNVTAIRAAWSGGAATAADGRLTGLRAELTAGAPALIEVDQVLAEFTSRLRRAKARLADAVAQSVGAGVLIDRQGRVSADPAVVRPFGWTGPGVTPVASGIRAALDLAGAADREAAARLDELAAAARSGWASPPPAYRPESGIDPAQVRRWWAELTPAQRRWLVAREPALVGRLDGVPAAARDQANRLLLGSRRELLLAERQLLLHRVPRGPVELAGLARVDASLAGLDALVDRLAAPAAPRAYLLGLDPTGDGRAVVALGNPDRADKLLTYVPGMTADLADVPGELGRAARVLARCVALAPAEETAAVLWLDYDAPDFLHEAASAGQARDAGPALHRFQEGLRLTHDGAPARQTVLGHSYGSVVVGNAARDHGLAADALVFVGSPGVGVDHAAALHVPTGQVWSSTAPDDVIRLARPPAELAGRAVLGAVAPALAGMIGRHSHELWFGHDPSHPGFGGRTFPSGRYGHTGYWEAGNPALDGMARIVLSGAG